MEKGKNKGSATIIVLVMFTIVLIFAISALNKVLNESGNSEVIAEWNEVYYLLDSKGTTAEYLIKDALLNAEVKTMSYMEEKEYTKDESTLLPIYAQSDVVNYYLEDKDEVEKLNNVMDSVYLFYANAYLQDLVNQVPELVITKNNDDVLIFDMSIECEFTTESGKTLEFTQEINPINYDITIDDDKNITYTKIDGDYVTTTNFYISQPPLLP